MNKEQFERLGDIICLAYAGAIGLPIFIFVQYKTTNLALLIDPRHPAHFNFQVVRIHWVVLWASVFLFFIIAKTVMERRLDVPARARLVGILLLAFGIALCTGLFIEPDILNGVYFAQTVVPVIGFMVGARVAKSVSAVKLAIVVFTSVTTFSIVCILLIAAVYGAFGSEMNAVNRLARGVPQLRDYFPFVVVCSMSLGLALFRIEVGVKRALLAACLAIHLSFYLLNWSRMGVIMLAVVLATPLLLKMRWAKRRLKWSEAGGVIGLLLLVGLFAIQGSIGERVKRANLQDSDNRRIQYAVSSLRTIADSPLTGRMFIADWDYDPYPGRELAVPRMFKAHNQYLDYGIRAGVPAMIALGVILAYVLSDLWASLTHASSGSETRSLVIGVAGAVLALIIGNTTQLLLVQAQTGSLAWLLIGVTFRLRSMADTGE